MTKLDYELVENFGIEWENKLFKDSEADSPISMIENGVWLMH